jgi:hypothetical protein
LVVLSGASCGPRPKEYAVGRQSIEPFADAAAPAAANAIALTFRAFAANNPPLPPPGSLGGANDITGDASAAVEIVLPAWQDRTASE